VSPPVGRTATIDRAPRTFTIERSLAPTYRWSAWFFVAMVVLFVALPFIPDGKGSRPSPLLIALMVPGALFFGVLARKSFQVLKQVPYSSIAADAEGLWRAHLARDDALIPWARVRSTKEHHYQQRLDLLDEQGKVLVGLEYQLSDFEALRALVSEKIQPTVETATGTVFAKNAAYHVFNVGSLIAFSALGIYVGSFNALVGYGMVGLVVAFCAYEYLTTIHRLRILSDRLELGYPLRTVDILRGEVEAVEIGDVFNRGFRQPVAGVVARGHKKPIPIADLGVDTMQLHHSLIRWKDGT
jgi:hypothetical protein